MSNTGQKNTVNVYRFISKDTIEEEIIERAKRKMVLEYSIIKTMDTSGGSILHKKGSRGATAGHVSNEELQTILKFGAQNLFKQEGQEGSLGANANKLEQLNLDDVLARAELHENHEESGTALGSAEFLEQFSVADVAVNQLTWEELIPENMRKTNTTEVEEIPEEFLLGVRRKATSVNYSGADIALEKPAKKKKAVLNPRKKLVNDPGTMNDKDIKNLLKAILKYGDLDQKLDQIVLDANLSSKKPKVVSDCANQIIELCTDAIRHSHEDKEEKKSRSISLSYGNVTGINASQLVQRISDMKFLYKRMSAQNISSFRITWMAKPIATWTTPWTPKDDAMLLAGIYKHGFGSWEAIHTDPELGMQGRFHLTNDDKLLPKSLHLTRRSEMLLKLLAENEAAKYSHKPLFPNLKPESSTSRPSKVKSEVKKVPKEKAAKSAKSANAPSARKARVSETKKETLAESYDDKDCKELLRPIKRELKALASPPKELEDQEKAHMIKTNLSTVGSFILNHCASLSEEMRVKAEKGLWKFASFFWPTEISSSAYKDLCTRVLQAADSEVAPASVSKEHNTTPAKGKEQELADAASSSRTQAESTPHDKNDSALQHRDHREPERSRDYDRHRDWEHGRHRDRSEDKSRDKRDHDRPRDRERERVRNEDDDRHDRHYRRSSRSRSPSRRNEYRGSSYKDNRDNRHRYSGGYNKGH